MGFSQHAFDTVDDPNHFADAADDTGLRVQIGKKSHPTCPHPVGVEGDTIGDIRIVGVKNAV